MLYIPFGGKSSIGKISIQIGQRGLGVDIVSDGREADIIVDAYLERGLSRELDKKTRELIVKLEALDGFKQLVIFQLEFV